LADFKKIDPNFSETLLLDYVQNVFHQYYSALGSDKIGNLKPFFINPLNTSDTHKYTEIVINALYIIGLDLPQIGNKIYYSIKVMLETNFTQTAADGRRLRYLSEQEWTFVRQTDVQSLPPAKMQALACPSCGAPESFHDNHKCGACGTTIEPGAMQWACNTQQIIFEETYQTNALVSYEAELGTNDLTIFAPNIYDMQSEFESLHDIDSTDIYFKDFTTDVVRPAFMAIYTAWTAKNLAPVRHLISDFLYQTQDFWIQEYKAQRLTNHLDDINISKVELAKIDIDKFYESFTVRIFASCKDYTIKDSNNSLVGGSKNVTRHFSEYWTFVRRIGMEQPPKDSLDLHACPSCSAPLDKMGMTGTCGYCSHKISSGEYSWVLSRITQDEAYN
jgi:ribosomal protein L37AE/L43A